MTTASRHAFGLRLARCACSGETAEWNLGIQHAAANVTIAALDATHVYRSGHPAQVWDGERCPLTFDANGPNGLTLEFAEWPSVQR